MLKEINGWVFSGQSLVKLPSPSTEDKPEIGSDTTDIEIKMLGGRSLPLMHGGFLNVEAAYRHRSGEAQDQLRADATIGVRYGKLTFTANNFNTFAVSDSTSTTEIRGVNDYDLSKFGLAAAYEFMPATTVQLSAYSDIRTRNTSDGNTIAFTVWRGF